LDDYRGQDRAESQDFDHLLHDAFSDDTQTQAEVDLVLDPDPPEERIAAVLEKYRFRDVKQAYRNLMSLAEERISLPFDAALPHFLAAIAPQLLAAIATTADPDSTLGEPRPSERLPGRQGVLWNCSASTRPACGYMSSFAPTARTCRESLPATRHDRQPDGQPRARQAACEGEHARTPGELCRAAEDIDPILHSFKNDQHCASVCATSSARRMSRPPPAALSDIAEVCLGQIAAREHERLADRFGQPQVTEGRRAGRPCGNGHSGVGQVRRPGNELPTATWT